MFGQFGAAEMLEGRRGFLVGGGQADPALYTVHAMAGGPRFGPCALAMSDAAARRHPVHIAGTDILHRAQSVAVHLRAIEQIGDGGKPDMGMGPHIDAPAGWEIHRAEIVEEDKGADAAPRGLRQEAGDEKTVAQVVCFSGDRDHGAEPSGSGVKALVSGKFFGRRFMLRKLATSAAFAALLAAGPAVARDTALQMVAIDVEGGGGTLFVTPEGKSLLIDTGNPEQSRLTGDNPSSARIVAAAHELGVKKIDYLIITHYHSDHIGGFEGLLARIPIGTVIDHGPNRETTASPNPTAPQIDMNNPPPGSSAYGYQHYIKLIEDHHLHHIVAKPGQVFHIGSLTDTIVMADAQPIAKPLKGAG